MIPLHDPGGFHDALLAMASQATRSLRLYSQTLDHDLYDTPAWLGQLAVRITERQKLRIRILVKDISSVLVRGHGAVALYHRLPSYVAVHAFPEAAMEDREEYAVFDDTGIIKRYVRSDLKGYCDFRSADAAIKSRQFDALWERSEPWQALRALHV